MKDYSQNIVKKYKYWTVSVHTAQDYLGKCVIWCDRKDAINLTDATDEELVEFGKIIKELKSAIEKSFQSDWMNYSFLGNQTRHLHCHMIPRYKDEREFNGHKFRDTRRGHNWLFDESVITSKELLQAIKTKLQENL